MTLLKIILAIAVIAILLIGYTFKKMIDAAHKASQNEWGKD